MSLHPVPARRAAAWALVVTMGLGACAPSTARVAAPAPQPASLHQPTVAELTRQAPDSFKVLFETTAGDFVVEVVREWAPRGADRFWNMTRLGYFDGVRFYRVVPRFVVQFGLHGDPAVNAAWRDTSFPDDPVRASNLRGTLTYAMAGPDTRSVQLFINLADNVRLDTQGFAPIGRVSGGMDAVDRFFAGYGEMAPGGRGPDQVGVHLHGEEYLAAEFPRLDRVVRARLVGSADSP